MREKKTEFRAFEFRASETGVIEGVVIPYGQHAKVAYFEERFLPGSVRYSDVIANVMHDAGRPIARTDGGGLDLTDGRDALRATIQIPDTQEGRDTHHLIKKGVYRGLSAEFQVLDDDMPDNLRTIRSAELKGLGIVDRAAYAGATVSEVRAAGFPQRFLDVRGENLARVLNQAIETKGDRAETLHMMATEAGISESTVGQILRGEVNAPPIERLEGFARVLSVRIETLIDAAEQDGGTYENRRADALWPYL